jgi:hypothetical protein
VGTWFVHEVATRLLSMPARGCVMPARGCVMPAKGCVIAIRLMPRHWRGLPAPASRCGDQLLANSRGNGLVHPFRIHSAHDLVFAVLDVLAPDGYLRRTLRRYSAPVSDVGCANLSPQPVSRIATAISSRPAGSSLSVPAQALSASRKVRTRVRSMAAVVRLTSPLVSQCAFRDCSHGSGPFEIRERQKRGSKPRVDRPILYPRLV